MTPDQPGGGVVTQSDLMRSIALRRRAKDAAAEANAHHRGLAARLWAGLGCEAGRYRPALATIEGMVAFAIHDRETADHAPIPIAWFNPKEIHGEQRSSPTHAEAHAEPEAPEAPEAEAPPDPEITQDELAKWRRMKARQKLLDADVSELTRSLIDRVKRRATVEPGKWLPMVGRQEARRFSLEVVEAAVGPVLAKAILLTIEPTVRESLSLIPDES